MDTFLRRTMWWKVNFGVVMTFLLACSSTVGIFNSSRGFDVVKADINTTYSKAIRKDEHQVFQYQLNSIPNSDSHVANLRVYAEVDEKYDNVTRDCPLHFTVRQREDVKAWDLPFSRKTEHNVPRYRKIERTLCFNNGDDIRNEDDLIVMISTCSNDYLHYSFKVEVTYDAFIQSGVHINKSVSLHSPAFYRYQYGQRDADTPVMVTATSDNPTCMILSIQKPECPVLETESTVRYAGHWQTVSTNAGITVRRKYFPHGFVIVMVILSDDSACEIYNGIVPPTGRKDYWKQLNARENSLAQIRNKTITLFVRELMDEGDYVLPILLPLSFYVVLILLVFLIFVGFHHLKLRIAMSSSSSRDDESLDEKVDFGCKEKLRATVFISDFVKADCKSLQKKSQQYFWSVTLVAVFYCAPTVQLIFNYVNVLYRTGEHDICYYNFLCAHPFKQIFDFNHLYSNVGYVILGLTFMLFVRLRQTSLKTSDEMSNHQWKKSVAERYRLNSSASFWRALFPACEEKVDHGILHHFGLFYAMGVALVMEGALSASYHLCPNQTNFQYDTSFMYVIAVLGIVKVYQFRHPVNVNANILLLVLAIVSMYTMFGLLFENLICKIVFTVGYALFVFNVLTYLYYVGYLKNQHDEVVTNWLDVYKYVVAKWRDDLKTKHSCLPWSQRTWTLETDSNIIQLKLGPNRVLLPMLGIFFNGVIIAMIWTIMIDSNFATQVLAMLIVNLVAYTGYYAAMKGIHDEYGGKCWLQTLMYGILMIVLWIFSLNYFRQAVTSWEQSPAESKVQNKECFFMDFYDEHDMWHFLSAGAMFCSFMVLLTLDDDLAYTPQTKIPVF